MITAVNMAKAETGIENYLANRFTQDGLLVPQLAAEATVATAAPKIVRGVSLEVLDVSDITVALRSKPIPAEVEGWHQPEVLITVVVPRLEGITEAHGDAVYDELLSCFPARPATNASVEDKAEWAQLHDELSGYLLAACGYNAGGWTTREQHYNKRGDRLERPLVVRLGLIHPDA